MNPPRALTFALALSVFIGASVAPHAEMIYPRMNYDDPASLDPAIAQTSTDANILNDLFEGLVTFDAGGNLVPGAAASWTISADGLVYIFKLDPNGKWSNGDSVTAEDFVYSLRRTVNPGTGAVYASVLFPIKNSEKINKGLLKPEELGVAALDQSTLQITLETPTAYFLGLAALQAAFAVHRGSVEKYGGDFTKPENLVGNGAFTLKSFIPHDNLTLVKNNYFRDSTNVKIDTEIVYLETDADRAQSRFEAGEILTYNFLSTRQIKLSFANKSPEFHVSPALGDTYLVFNLRKKPFDDVRVRHALSMAVDRETLADIYFPGAAIPGYTFIPPGIGNYTTPASLPYKGTPMAGRMADAIALMTEAGYGPDHPLGINLLSGGFEQDSKAYLRAIAQMWKPLGVELTITDTEYKTLYAIMNTKGDFDLAQDGWDADYSDPQTFLHLGESNNDLNFPTYSNPEFDALMQKAASTIAIGERAKVLLEADRIMIRDEPFLLLFTTIATHLLSKRISGWEPNPLDVHPTRFLSVSP